jgi:flagellar FliJ protein
MTKTSSLQPLLNLAQQRNETATKHLGQLNQQQQSAQAKLDALLQYRKDYQDKFQEAVRNGMNPTELRNFQDFIYRLDEAITQQRQVANHAERSVQHGREELKSAQIKLKSFDALVQRYVESSKMQESKQEQKLMDEHAGRSSAYRHPDSEGD